MTEKIVDFDVISIHQNHTASHLVLAKQDHINSPLEPQVFVIHMGNFAPPPIFREVSATAPRVSEFNIEMCQMNSSLLPRTQS
jgi:hypothetical protein